MKYAKYIIMFSMQFYLILYCNLTCITLLLYMIFDFIT